MFTTEHLETMGDLFNGFRNFLHLAPAGHLKALGIILEGYTNQRCELKVDSPEGEGFPGLLAEVAALLMARAVDGTAAKEYEAVFHDEGRRLLALHAACCARELGDAEVRLVHKALLSASASFPSEQSEPKPKLAVVAPAAKGRRKARKAA